jgi:hypothetical protein
MMIALLFGATLFNNYLDMLGFARGLAEWLDAMQLTPMTALLAMMLVYLVLGLFLESLSMMLLTIPIFFPLVQVLGIDPVWFGILVVVAIEISLITPPVGLNVFILKIMVKNISLTTIFRGIVPFFIADLVRLALLRVPRAGLVPAPNDVALALSSRSVLKEFSISVRRTLSDKPGLRGAGGSVACHDAQTQPIHEPRDHPFGGDALHSVSVVAKKCRGHSPRARHRGQPRDGAVLLEPARSAGGVSSGRTRRCNGCTTSGERSAKSA